MKNTMGYALNAFLDFDTPLSSLASAGRFRGNVGVHREAVFRTIRIFP